MMIAIDALVRSIERMIWNRGSDTPTNDDQDCAAPRQ